MKKLRLLIPVLLFTCLLNGCGFSFRFFLPAFGESALPQAEEELTVGEEVASHLDAEDIYYRCKFAVGDGTFQYATRATIGLVFSQDFDDFVVPMQWDSEVMMDPETCAVNETIRVCLGSEDEDVFH